MSIVASKRKSRKSTSVDLNAQETPDYITLAQYIERRLDQDLKKDPLAKPLYHGAINRLEREEVIEFYLQGKYKFIDWNKYKNVLFRRFCNRK